jgi:hypothetical protein
LKTTHSIEFEGGESGGASELLLNQKAARVEIDSLRSSTLRTATRHDDVDSIAGEFQVLRDSSLFLAVVDFAKAHELSSEI